MARSENYNIVSKRKQNGYEQQKIESKIIVVQIQCGWLKGAPTQNTHLWKESIMEVVVVVGGGHFESHLYRLRTWSTRYDTIMCSI